MTDTAPSAKPTSAPSAPHVRPSLHDTMPPMAKAGVDLTQSLLWMLGATITLLVAVFAMGHLHQRSEHADLIYLASRRTAKQIRVVGSDATTMLRQEVAEAVARSEHRPAPSQPIEQAVAALRQIPALDQARSEALGRCPAALRATTIDAQRSPHLLDCLTAIDSLQRDSHALADPQSLRLLMDVMRVAQEERAAFSQNWLAMA